MRFQFIRAHRDQWPVAVQCRVLQVSTSGYYAWQARRDSIRLSTDDELCEEIRGIFEDTRGAYGVPRMTAELKERGHLINPKRVSRLMREMGLRGRHARRFRPTTTVTDPDGLIAEDLLQQDFTAEGPNQRWVGDITYLTTSDGFEYLATVMDLYSRRIIGWALSPSLDATIAIEAIQMALRQRKPPPGVIFHSDRGCQYTSEAFRDVLDRSQVRRSMGRTGCCYDNAAAESFFHSLKVEWLHGREIRDREAMRSEVFSYIEGFYNRRRRHSFVGNLSPEAFEAKQAVAA